MPDKFSRKRDALGPPSTHTPEPCCCEAYPFPHRPMHGNCYYAEGEYDALPPSHFGGEGAAEDSPQHGQAADLNKKPAR